MTGFEFHPKLWIINKIQNFRVQMAAKSSRLCANLQPIATKILMSKNGWLPINPERRRIDEPALDASLPRTQHPR